MAAATSGTHRYRSNIKIATIVSPIAAPTAIAAGRFRPARDFFGFFRPFPGFLSYPRAAAPPPRQGCLRRYPFLPRPSFAEAR